MRRLPYNLIILAVTAMVSGCADSDLAQRAEDRVPDRMRGVSASYDLAGIGYQPPPEAPPVEMTYDPSPPAKMIVWWETADGVVHCKEVETRGGTINPERFAGSLWVEVTPIGARPKRLATKPAQ